MKKILLLSSLVAISCSTPKEIPTAQEEINIIPKPNALSVQSGYFTFDQNTKFLVPDSLKNVAEILTSKFKIVKNWDMKLQPKGEGNNSVQFVVDKSIGKEGYTLKSDKNKVVIKASDYNGFVYGVETLRQLLPTSIESKARVGGEVKWTIPSVSINDYPAYPWRGLMLDVSRHFFPKEYIIQTLDRMALLKLNTFHFHLIDNEGWRIEIKKYPKLTEVGAWRENKEHLHWNEREPDNKRLTEENRLPSDSSSEKNKPPYGGFYTQEDIKEIVAYAQKLGINVIPEIEMPAHSMSAIAAYPYLSCHKEQIRVPSGGIWPITDIYCAGQEETFTFLEDVLTEVMELFPSKYIHIGGDEATHTEWAKCKACNQRMKDHHLADVHELQSYFIKRIEKFLLKNGRTLVGWDEIIDGGLPNTAVVMNWRGIDVVKQSIDQKHKVILTSDFYINKYQGLPDNEPLAIGGYLPLKDVYSNPLEKDKLTAEEQKYILGGQANLWAEYIGEVPLSEYMIFPRLLAISEIDWNAGEKNWDNFIRRVEKFLPRLDAMGVNYAKSIYQVTANIQNIGENKEKIQISLESEAPNSDIRYLLDGNDWNKAQKYTSPIVIDKTANIKAVTFLNGKPHTAVYDNTITFHKAQGKPVTYDIPYHKNYTGRGDGTLTNVLKATKNFHDKEWLGWLGQDTAFIIDLQEEQPVERVVLNALEEQGQGIYFPLGISVYTSLNGKNFTKVAHQDNPYKVNGHTILKDFTFNFEKQDARYIRVELNVMKKSPINGDAWLFLDEVQVF
ncbi:MAG: family 20 glycosylhydrolase [Capnocytophaga sp.]|nr:family 20 glycosylhydrolase [Capnocytophaga sp.]